MEGIAHQRRQKTLFRTQYFVGALRAGVGCCLGFLVVLNVFSLLVGAAGNAFLIAWTVCRELPKTSILQVKRLLASFSSACFIATLNDIDAYLLFQLV